jgi:hypothetical protein
MKRKLISALCMALPLAAVIGSEALAAGANWKMGRVYNRLVCNDCHRQDDGKVMSPSERTIADWKAYFAADKHAASGKANPSVKFYASQEYRHAIKAENKAAAKFLKLPDEEMMANVVAFYLHGAKDSDTPLRCQ